ncbi:MAG TPA: amidase [Gammaproteobacteria bacterium]
MAERSIDIAGLCATELAARLRARELRALDVAERYLDRIREREPSIHAWACIEPDRVRERARALDAGPIAGPLHGVPLGVKDIIDTADLPTAYGSPIYAGHRPAADAACVAAARRAGAVVLGKTVTTEFAFLAPAATVNPHDFAHTPGGSSSGSAAAVADGMVPLAFGTQTGGSIIRPASFCGVVGYKPTFGTLPREGVKMFADSLDTVGVLARTVADAGLLVGALASRGDLVSLPGIEAPPRIGACRTHDWTALSPEMQERLEQAAETLARAGARVEWIELPGDFAGLGDAHAAIQAFEAVRNLARERREHAERLSALLRRQLEEGDAVTPERYARAQSLAAACRAQLPSVFGDCDVLLAASATGEAPRGLASTGSPIMNRVWTLLHVPCVGVPAGTGPSGLPLGLQVIGREGDDARTLACAAWIHCRLG